MHGWLSQLAMQSRHGPLEEQAPNVPPATRNKAATALCCCRKLGANGGPCRTSARLEESQYVLALLRGHRKADGAFCVQPNRT